MMTNNVRLMTIIVLIAMLPMLSGWESVVFAALSDRAEKSCCGDCNHEEGQSPAPGPASSPDCPFILCLSLDAVAPFTPAVVFTEIAPHFAIILQPLPDPFVRSIFHPPPAA
jgi:hypothetical protein